MINEIAQEIKIKRRSIKLQEIADEEDLMICLYKNQNGHPDTAINMAFEGIGRAKDVAERHNLKMAILKDEHILTFVEETTKGLDVIKLCEEQWLFSYEYEDALTAFEDELRECIIDVKFDGRIRMLDKLEQEYQIDRDIYNIRNLQYGKVYVLECSDTYDAFDTRFKGKEEYIIALIE